MAISNSQRVAFFKLWHQVEAKRDMAGLSKQERDDYRHEQIMEATGKGSVLAVASGSQFEDLMVHCAMLAEDPEAAAYWCQADDRRIYNHLKACVRQCAEIRKLPSEEAVGYVRSVCVQARIPDDPMDLSVDDAKKVLFMVDTHRRRLLDRIGFRPLKFNPARYFRWTGNELASEIKAVIN